MSETKQPRLYPRNRNPSLWITSGEIKLRGELKRRENNEPIAVSVDGEILAF